VATVPHSERKRRLFHFLLFFLLLLLLLVIYSILNIIKVDINLFILRW
jgi:uncharacterized integral membrane protein